MSHRVPRQAWRPCSQDLVRAVEMTPASPGEKRVLLYLAPGGSHMTRGSTLGAARARARIPGGRLTRGVQRPSRAYPSSTSTLDPSPRGVAGLRIHPRGSGRRFMQEPASELRRITLPRTRVDRFYAGPLLVLLLWQCRAESSRSLHPGCGQVLVDQPHGHRALAHRGGYPLDRTGAHVARREHAGQARLQGVRLPRAVPPEIPIEHGAV